MTQKEIRKLYLSFIDNPDAVWDDESRNDYLLLNCTCGNLKIKSYQDNQLVFSYSGRDSGFDNTSKVFSYEDIGISYFRLMFPFFGIAARVKRRIKNDKKNKEKKEAIKKLDSISTIIAKDKALLRDSKLNQLLK
jgi:hypothetical protein